MTNRIKWNEDKTKDYRGNWQQCLFKVDNSDHIFGFCSYMTYKCFKSEVRKFAQNFNCKEVTIIEDNGQYTMTVLSYYSGERNCDVVEFRIELPVPENTRRQFTYYKEEDIFNA
jgi:hypothetical protein